MISEIVTPKVRSGRPSVSQARERRQFILDVAVRLFAEQGYAATSLDAVAKAAGASKATLYRQFDSKEALFTEVLESLGRPEEGQLLRILSLRQPPREVLEQAALFVLRLALQPETLVLYRLVFSEIQRCPQFAKAFYDRIASEVLRPIQDYLDRCVAAGRLELKDTALAADQFFELVTGLRLRRALLGVDSLGSEEDYVEATQTAIDLFLKGCERTSPQG